MPGPLKRIADEARNAPGKPFVLVIDEINRANIAKVFGELYFLLEYREAEIELLYSDGQERFTLPESNCSGPARCVAVTGWRQGRGSRAGR